jgi:hypothetical protein
MNEEGKGDAERQERERDGVVVRELTTFPISQPSAFPSVVSTNSMCLVVNFFFPHSGKGPCLAWFGRLRV